MDRSLIFGLVISFVGVWFGTLLGLPEARKVYKNHLLSFSRWLRGSRTTFYLLSTNYHWTTKDRLRKYVDRGKYPTVIGQVIEISQGLFRRRSGIYGPNPCDWKVYASSPRMIYDLVFLRDTKGLSAETALRVVNQYPSLQAMLDRIAELELQLEASEERCSNLRFYATGWRFLVTRLYDKVAKPQDKRRFKGGDAREIVKELWLMIELQSKRELQTGL